ncbi:MAG: hypothetical protein H0W72_17480 [Planctomycetes bacterium]|nr:hypothetical protein [Planctomycetota bacterium]
MGNAYRIVHSDFGWHAVPLDGRDETRVFETRESAHAWCEQRLATAIDADVEERAAHPPLARR